jgi:HSP20 family protein
MSNKSGTALSSTAGREFLAFDPFRSFEERMRRVFGEGFYPFKEFDKENWSLGVWSPTCDIYETESDIVVKAELPEVNKEDVNVSIDNNVLTIRGERKFSKETKKENYHRLERSYGEFGRSFTLPNFVDPGKVSAEFKDGLLRVTLPKREEAKPKQVEVRVQ